MKRLLTMLLLVLAAPACGDGEVNLAYANRADDGRVLDTGDSTGDETGDAPGDEVSDGADPIDDAPAYDGNSRSAGLLLSLEGDALTDALSAGEISFSADAPFEALDISWRGEADLTLVTTIEREVKPDFSQRGAHDALVELDQPTSSASLRANVSELTFLRISAISGSPTQGDDR